MGVTAGMEDRVSALIALTTSLVRDRSEKWADCSAGGLPGLVDTLRGWLVKFKSLPKIG